MQKFIVVRGAREHNLKDITVEIPRDSLTVITGLSGSGKSSLAFDTIYAEGQRRYVESLSAYARQFLQPLQNPTVAPIDGPPPPTPLRPKPTPTGKSTFTWPRSRSRIMLTLRGPSSSSTMIDA